MNSLSIIFTFACLVSWTSANPIAGAFEISNNDLFSQINSIIKRGIDRQLKNDSVAIGDKLNSDDGSVKISVQEFTSNHKFPVRFRPQDKEVLDDKKVITVVDDFDGSSEYVIKKTSSESSEESSEEKSTKKLTKPTENVPTTSTSTSSGSSTSITNAASSTVAASSTAASASSTTVASSSPVSTTTISTTKKE